MAALKDQAELDTIEIIAVGNWESKEQLDSKDEHFRTRQRYPAVRWLSVSADTTVPQMRTIGILQSCGEVIALLEDDCVVTEDWCLAALQAHIDLDAAIGGAILPGDYRRLLDWAVFFCEYARFMPPFSGAKSALPGNHVTYKRAMLPPLGTEQGFYEVFFHEDLLQSGKQLIADPALLVRNVNQWSVRHITQLPFHHGRAFAGMRAADFPIWRKGLYATFSVGLPALKAFRLATEIVSRWRYKVKFCLSLPLVLIFFTSWSIGELCGYAAGPGNSPGQWR